MIKNVESLSLLDILPANILEDEKVAAAAQALDREIKEVTKATIEVLHISRIDELPEAVVDLLAWQWHVDFYDQNLSLEKRRALVKNSIRWHMKKGTKAAVEEMVQTVFEGGRVTEWFEYNGEPYHFKIDLLEAPGISQENIDTVVRLVKAVKNTRSWLDSVGFFRKITGPVYMGGAPMIHKSYSVGPAQIHDTTNAGGYYMGAIPHTHKSYRVEQVPASNQSIRGPVYTGAGLYIHKDYKIQGG